jgi:hypothetical protein
MDRTREKERIDPLKKEIAIFNLKEYALNI